VLIIMRVLLIALCAACTQSYHPEYHPVTVTTIHQSSASVTPAPIVVEQPRLADPEVFFQKP
jgi:hypothetical protein